MKRQLTASAVSLGTRSEGDASAGVAVHPPTALNNSADTQAAPDERRIALTSVSAWTHTLVLTGKLDQRSAATLEAEMDRLCEEGVTGITLDLRGLTYIDSAAVAAISFRCGLSQRRGYDFALIPGAAPIQDAFERAGIADVLPFHAAPADELCCERGS